jgi:hypothetical protein
MRGVSDMLVLRPSEFGLNAGFFSNPISDIEHIWQMSWRTSFYRGGPVFMSALAGIDIALWDLKGKKGIKSSSSADLILQSSKARCSNISAPRWEGERQNQSLCLDWR